MKIPNSHNQREGTEARYEPRTTESLSEVDTSNTSVELLNTYPVLACLLLLGSREFSYPPLLLLDQLQTTEN